MRTPSASAEEAKELRESLVNLAFEAGINEALAATSD